MSTAMLAVMLLFKGQLLVFFVILVFTQIQQDIRKWFPPFPLSSVISLYTYWNNVLRGSNWIMNKYILGCAHLAKLVDFQMLQAKAIAILVLWATINHPLLLLFVHNVLLELLPTLLVLPVARFVTLAHFQTSLVSLFATTVYLVDLQMSQVSFVYICIFIYLYTYLHIYVYLYMFIILCTYVFICFIHYFKTSLKKD